MELKPCPFCGEYAQIVKRCYDPDGGYSDTPLKKKPSRRHGQIISVLCDCGVFVEHENFDEAIAAWNARVSPEREALEKIEVLSRPFRQDNENDLSSDVRYIHDIATAALEGK